MIGHKIQKLRELKNYTQEYMAEQLKMSQANYSRLENNSIEMSLDKLQVIAKVLEISLEDLISLDEKVVFNISNNHRNGIKEFNMNNPLNSQEKKMYDELIKRLQSENEHLREVNEHQRGIIDKLLNSEN